MSPAEYKIACEATGRPVSELADLLGVARSTIYRRWEPGAVITGEMVLAVRAIPKARRAKKYSRNAPVEGPAGSATPQHQKGN